MSEPILTRYIQNEILQNGPIPFVTFMEIALYHPKYGYYSAPGEKIGWKGDFYTSSTVHPIFGELLAKQLLQMWEIFGGSRLAIVEVGAGLGELCRDILHFIQVEYPKLFEQIDYIIVEKSDSLKEAQTSLLFPLFSESITWKDEVPDQLTGIILSNELLDAFPVHRIRIDANSIQEVHVDWGNGQFKEVLKSPSTPRIADYISHLRHTFKKPVNLEINLQAVDWILQIGKALKQGFVITIDYGYRAEELYSSQRDRGTFLCYHRHKVTEDPYQRIGEQDMTAHVDFTSLEDQGKNVGLLPVGFTDQTHFLMGLGIAQRMEEPANKMHESKEARREFLAMRQLMAPEGMGETFKILIQGKNIPAKFKLDGLQFRPFFP
ncbi:MAG: class I SAM-dependent methyltransferase [Nitrospiria bacterium]